MRIKSIVIALILACAAVLVSQVVINPPSGAVSGGTLTIGSGALVLATTAIGPNGACQTVTPGSVNSAALTGALSTDTVTWTPNASIKAVTGYAPTAAQLQVTPYVNAGFVNFDVCNPTTGSITPGGVTLNYRLVR